MVNSVAQMFNFLNLGFDGYRRIAQSDMANARMLSRALEASGYFTVGVLHIRMRIHTRVQEISPLSHHIFPSSV